MGAFAQTGEGGGPPAVYNIGLLVLLVGVFYIVLLRPEQKRRREHEQMVAGLKRIDQAVDTTLDRQMQDLERELRDAQIGASTLERDGRNIHLRLANVDKRSQVLDLLKDRFPSLVLVPTPDAEPGELAMTLEPREIQRVRDNVQEQALKIIRNRIDQFGVAEPTVQAQGADEIVVQLPGIQDPERAKELIGRTALLD